MNHSKKSLNQSLDLTSTTVEVPKKKKKLTPQEKQAWFDWAIPFSPQSHHWHESEEARLALKRYLLSQMVLVAEDKDLRETILRAQKNNVDLNLIAEQAILLDKKDLFFTIARHLKVNWNGWMRAQIQERSNLNEILTNMNATFKTDLEERYRYPTMVHFLIHHQPEWVSLLFSKGWNPANPFEIKDTHFLDYPICRAWMENQVDLVNELWSLPEVHSNQDNKDAFLNLLSLQNLGDSNQNSKRIYWLKELLYHGANPNRVGQIKPGHPPAGMSLLHQVLRFPWGENFCSETQLLAKLSPESWPASTWPKGMVELVSSTLGEKVVTDLFIRDCLSLVLKAPESPKDSMEKQIVNEIVQGKTAIGTWYLDEGYRLSFQTCVEKFVYAWKEQGGKGIDLHNPTKPLYPGVCIVNASWSLIGSFMSNEDEQKWEKLGKELKDITPQFTEKAYKISREGCQIWFDKVLLKVQEHLVVDLDNETNTSKKSRL